MRVRSKKKPIVGNYITPLLVGNMKKIIYILKEILKTTLNILVIAILPLVVFTLITSKVDLIAQIRSFVVLTGSMSPLIPAGAVVFSQTQPNYNYNDIITFDQGGINITHRIKEVVIENNETFYRTQGDANNSADSTLIPQNKVVGKALFHFPYIGKLIMYLKSLTGFATLIILPTLIFIGFELYNIKKELERSVERKILERINAN